MHWIDYTIFVILFFATVMGLASGPLLQILRIGCLFVSFFTALLFHDILSRFLKGIFTASTAGLLGWAGAKERCVLWKIGLSKI